MGQLFSISESEIVTVSKGPPPAQLSSSQYRQPCHDKPKIVSAYRWEDESNGEIYTDIPVEQGDGMKDLPLYVVENGQEFPLLPLSQRKTSFEFVPRLPSQPSATTLASSLIPNSTRPSTLALSQSSVVTESGSKVIMI